MTDNEIIKALECCLPQNGKRNCDDCPYAECEKGCADKLTKDSLDLINRQKAELEKLKTQLGKRENFFTVKYDEEKLKDIVKSQIEKFEVDIVIVRNEAIREFAEKLKNVALPIQIGGKYEYEVVTKQAIDHFVKEMTEGENG